MTALKEKASAPTKLQDAFVHHTDSSDPASNGTPSKAIRTLIAEFAIGGYEAQSLGGGAYLVSDSLGNSRFCEDISELYAVAREAGVAA